MANEGSPVSNSELQEQSMLKKSHSAKSFESYSKHHKHKSDKIVEKKMGNSGRNANDETFQDEIVMIFDSNGGSPYSRRHPIFVNKELRSDLETAQFDCWTPSSIISSDEEPDNIDQMNTDMEELDLTLPIELTRYPSMQSLRNRRDPHYQGIRTRRSRRVIEKSGDRNVGFLHIPERSRRFFKDFVTTLIEEQWRCVITMFALSFIICWILFAALWYLIAHSHGDLSFDPKTGESLSEGPVPCIEGAKTFAGFLLFSIETQVSIGFGEKYPNEECPEAIFLMVAQIITGIAIEGAMVGIVYAKMARPPKRPAELKFSRKAVVCQRDSKLCLLFRVCDIHEMHAVESKIHAYWFEERVSMEGEILHQFQQILKLENDGRLFMLFPVVACHVIDNFSPLYNLSAKDLLEKKFEIVVTLTGSSRSTGQLTEERTSYLPKEIMWGHRFTNIVNFDRGNEVFEVDYEHFDDTVSIDTPLCSAQRLDEMFEEVQSFFENNPSFDSDFKDNHHMESNDYSRDMTNLNLVKELQIHLSQYSLNETKNANKNEMEEKIN